MWGTFSTCLARCNRAPRIVFAALTRIAVDIERHNYREIELLNQRGGRTLSIVDLVRAGTLNVPMAAYAMRAIERGASILTAARPGGAGKTTLLQSLLHLLLPGVRLVTVDRPQRIATALATIDVEPECYLVHEIGDGHWFGYLWGPTVAEYAELVHGPRRIASCLHADTLDELIQILGSPPLGVAPEALGRIGLILFMHVSRSQVGYRRRVATLYEADADGIHRLRFAWDAESDTFRAVGDLGDPQALRPYEAFIEQLVAEHVCDPLFVRQRVLQFYSNERS